MQQDLNAGTKADTKPNIKIIVASHKSYWMPSDSIYLPVQVGAAGKESIPGFQRDDTGENISEKNSNYCELTALYWAWKNLDADFFGLAHYRRHFKGEGEHCVLTQHEAETLVEPDMIVVPKKRNYYIETIYDHYTHAHHSEPLDEALAIIGVDDRYKQATEVVMNRRWLYIFNMAIFPKSLFDGYCEWLFDILGKVEAKIDMSDWSIYEQRAMGFLSERLFNIWLEANNIQVKERAYTTLEAQHWMKKIVAFLKRRFTSVEKMK